MSAFSQFFLGTPSQAKQLPTFTDEQQQLLSQILGSSSGPLSSGFQNLQNILGGSPEAFSAFERPAMRQFQEEIIPSIAERFGGMGAGSSSGFQQTLARAGERLSENLSAQRAGLQNQSLNQLMQLLGTGLSPQFQYQKQEGTTGLLPDILSILGHAASGGMQGMGNVGRRMGSGISSLFSGNKNEPFNSYTGMMG